MQQSHGPRYEQFRGRSKEAIEYLLKVRRGEVPGAFHYRGVGDIDLPWGKEGDPNRGYRGGYGLAHIAAKHADVVDRLSDILEGSVILRRSPRYVELINKSEPALIVIGLEWENQSKTWLLTQYKVPSTAIDKYLAAADRAEPISDNLHGQEVDGKTNVPRKKGDDKIQESRGPRRRPMKIVRPATTLDEKMSELQEADLEWTAGEYTSGMNTTRLNFP